MTRDATRLLEKALRLSVEDRARIASQLLVSLDEQQEDVRAAWAAEITRRLAEADADPDNDEDCARRSMRSGAFASGCGV